MRLFLTSSPCADAEELPFVYREENGFAERLRERLPERPRGVMLAAYPEEHEHNDGMAEDFALALEALGCPPEDFRMLDGRCRLSEIHGAVRRSDLVILSGGHVPTQNRWFHKIRLASALKDYPGVVMGISAGTMNCCDPVYAQPEEPGEAADPAYRRFLPGLGLTRIMVLPHYQQVRDNRVDGLHLFDDLTIPDSRGRTFYALPDGSYVLQEDGRALLCGEAWLIRDGVMTAFTQPGEERIL
ncbi:MAG: Type 1 glutamine amidotransferase-like domain-containing protein [Clostridia bacterium]|nr:Type 1 glutamine amidotransferase-like domain-containing protein [Clostridia bacterium]